jgi:hypothetical protein
MSRHKWTEIGRDEHRTTRRCDRCGLFKVSRHEPPRHWQEFWRATDHLDCEATPPCEPAIAAEARGLDVDQLTGAATE